MITNFAEKTKIFFVPLFLYLPQQTCDLGIHAKITDAEKHRTVHKQIYVQKKQKYFLSRFFLYLLQQTCSLVSCQNINMGKQRAVYKQIHVTT